MKRRLLTSLVAAFIGFGLAPYAAQSATLTYRDWSVTCDNLKTCMAYSVSSQSEGGLSSRPRGASEVLAEGWMTIERAAGPGSVMRILLSRPDLSSNSLPSDAQIHLLGANGRVVPRGIFSANLGSQGVIEIAPSLTTSFLSVARGANHAVLVVGAVKRKVFFVSLSGLVASGRAIDVHQGRTGTPSAMIDTGRKPDASVPPAPVRPSVLAQPFTKRSTVRPPAAVMTARARDCDDAERFDRGGTNIESFNLGNGRILWSVPCGAGSYNTWNQFYVEPPRTVLMTADFVGRPLNDGEEDTSLTNVSIDPAKGMITAFYKGRGLGDCGSAETYVWTGSGFILTEHREMMPCGGILREFWPSVVSIGVRQRPAR